MDDKLNIVLWHIVLVICLVFFTSCEDNDYTPTIWSKEHNSINCTYLFPDTTTGFLINIKDTSNKGLIFTFTLNDQFWFHPDSMLKYINHIPVKDSFKTSKEIIQAWKFLNTHTMHASPVSESSKLIHNPAILINSAGYGFCDDRASALAAIWKYMDFKTRIHDIEDHHVFPEVKENNRWKMLDPDLGIIVHSNNNIASFNQIKEHQRSPEFTYLSSLHKSIHDFFVKHEAMVTHIYQASLHHAVNPWYTDKMQWFPAYFFLPASSAIEFPVKKTGWKAPAMKITIPGQFRGFVHVPLLVHRVENAYSRAFTSCNEKGKTIQTGTIWLDGENISLYAMINPLLLPSKGQVAFTYHNFLSNHPVIDISPASNDVHNGKTLLKICSNALHHKSRFMQKLLNHIQASPLSEMHDRNDFLTNLKAIYMDNPNMPDTTHISKNLEHLDEILCHKPNSKAYFYKKMNNPLTYCIFLFILDSINEAEMEIMVNYLLEKQT